MTKGTRPLVRPFPTVLTIVRGAFDGKNGLERIFYGLTERLKAEGGQHVLFCYGGAVDPAGREALESAGGTVWVPERLHLGRGGVPGYKNFLKEIAACCRQTETDIIMGHYSRPGNVAALAGWFLKISAVRVIHSGREVGRSGALGAVKEGMSRSIHGLAGRLTDRTVVVSKHISDYERSCGVPSHKIELIYHGADAKHCQPRRTAAEVRSEFGIPPGATILLIGASLATVKGHQYLIRAIAGLTGEKPYLLVAGRGPLEGQLKQMTVERGLPNNVLFLGVRKDVPDLINASDCVVLSSLSEGFPQILVEAYLCKRPVIASRVGGIGEIVVHGETGVLTEPGDIGQIREAIIDLQRRKDVWILMGESGYQRVKDLFSMTRTMDRYLEVCREVHSRCGQKR